MDLRNSPDAATAESGDWEDLRDAAADQMTSTAKHALNGCIFDLAPNAAQTHVLPGEAYLDGNRLRLREAEAIDLAGVTRPTGTMVAWVAILASYTTETEGTVTGTAPDGVGLAQYVRHTRDAITITLTRGVNAASQAAAVKPEIPSGSIVLCDVLLDATTAVGSLTGDPSRRPKCPDDELREQDDLQWDAIRAIQATLASALQGPDQGPTPSATSTTALRIDATWAAGTVPAGAPAITSARFRWRRAGENWADGRTFELNNVQAYEFTVPNADADVQMQVAYRNSNGAGEWSDIGMIAATDIEAPPALVTRTVTADETWTWPYPQSTQARITLTGGAGGGGAGGGGGGAGGRNTSQRDPGGDGGGMAGGAGGAEGADGSPGSGRGGGGGGGGDGGGATGGPDGGGDGGDGGGGVQDKGGGGGGGEAGADGSPTRMTVTARGVDQSADGGSGGDGGDGGDGGSTADGADGTDAMSLGGGGAHGNGGAGGDDDRDGGAGGDGAPGVAGQQVITDISGLQVGDTITITIGDGGEGSEGGDGGGGANNNDGTNGTNGTAGSAGRVTIEPLT